jgi:Flp pilus assembly protein TadD
MTPAGYFLHMPHTPEKRNEWLPYICIAALSALVYHKAVFFGYSYLDDQLLIINNHDFLRNASNFFEIFKRHVFYPAQNPLVFYRPLLTLSFMLDMHVTGLCPAGYHLTNILIHTIASCLFFVFLLRLGYRKAASFVVACLFTVHPILSQAVAWIPGRNDSLLAVFVLASSISFIDLARTGRLAHCGRHLLFFTAALFTKESGLAVVPLCLLYYYIIAKKRGIPSELKYLLAGWGLILLAWLVLRHPVLKDAARWTVFDASRSLSIIVPAFIQYAGKIIFPVNLSVAPVIQDTPLLYGWVAMGLLAAAVLGSRLRRGAFLVFGAAWLALFLAPSVICPDFEVVVSDFMEHRIYVPLIGFAIILLECDITKTLHAMNRKALAASALIVALFAGITYANLGRFKDRISFWENAARASAHSSLAHQQLGIAYYFSGALDKAERECKASLALNPREPRARAILGQIYMGRNKMAEAEKEFKKEIALYPSYDNTYACLGVLYYKEGRMAEAEALWKKALEKNPDNTDASRNLAVYYFEKRDGRQALYHVETLRKRGINFPPEFLDRIKSLE